MAVQNVVIVGPDESGNVTIQMGPYGYGTTVDALFTPPDDSSISVINNIGTFLREAGYSTLTEDAKAAVAAHDFRY
jgi:hypothetical protein